MRAQIVCMVTVIAWTALPAPAAAQTIVVPAPPAAPALPVLEFFALQQLPQPPQPRVQRRGGQPRGPETTENFSQTARITGNGSVDVQNLAGNIVVMGGGGNSVLVQAVKRAFGRTEEERRRALELVTIEVREQSGRVDIRTQYPDNMRNANVLVDYTIALPQDASVSIRTLSGDVRAGNVRGELRMETASGDIDASGARRIAALKTLSGDITLNDAQADGDINVQTMSGALIARNVRARSVDFTSISGDLQLSDVQSDRVTARTMSGDITYTGQLQRTRFEFNTHNGDILLQVAGDGFDLDASTLGGEITSAFPVTLGGGNAQRGRRPGQAVRATFGNGGAALSLRSFAGDIVINRR